MGRVGGWPPPWLSPPGSRGCGEGSTYQEGAEHGDGGEEVPDVVVVEEVEQDAVAVVLPGLGWGFL